MINQLVSDTNNAGFYPTPESVSDILLEGIDWRHVSHILEPSAGTGNLVEAAVRKYYDSTKRRYNEPEMDIDLIEADPNLRAVLQYKFGKARYESALAELRSLQNNCHCPTPEQIARYEELHRELDLMKAGKVHIVHDDFLTFRSMKEYDLIIMNPPFADGDAHLLKALQLLEPTGGQIRCILNAETIRNPYTNRRRELVQALDSLRAEISFHQNYFSTAERKTDVEIAIIRVAVPAKEYESEIYHNLRQAEEYADVDADPTDLSVPDYMERIMTRYRMECEAGIRLIREYRALRPFISDDFRGQGSMLSLTVAGERCCNVNDYLRKVRGKYWEALLKDEKFVGQLTSNLREKYMRKVSSLSDYDFTDYNIGVVAAEMNAELAHGIQETIVAMFDKLTIQHAWYPETANNVHYYNGWATNKAHKIGMKVIIPGYDLIQDNSREAFSVYYTNKVLSDIEKVFQYLDGNMTAHVDLTGVLETASKSGQTKNIHCKFFDVTLYKKGTVHIKFHDSKLVERFNIYCGQKKNWLPPFYGRTAYADMSAEAKAIVDGFNGTGTSGSGEKAYSEIVRQAGYYLTEPARAVLAITDGAA